jgi:hypothetical protein
VAWTGAGAVSEAEAMSILQVACGGQSLVTA